MSHYRPSSVSVSFIHSGLGDRNQLSQALFLTLRSVLVKSGFKYTIFYINICVQKQSVYGSIFANRKIRFDCCAQKGHKKDVA